jgi:hypothetical protein
VPIIKTIWLFYRKLIVPSFVISMLDGGLKQIQSKENLKQWGYLP